MDRLRRITGVGVLAMSLCVALSHPSLSAEQAVYEKPEIEQPGPTIVGRVVRVLARDAATNRFDVSVENKATGEVIILHLDKSTAKKEKTPDPAIGQEVIVKYDEKTNHAISFVWDSSPNPKTP